MIVFNGFVNQNRFVNGVFTDGENCLVEHLKKDNSLSKFLSDILNSTLNILHYNKDEVGTYLKTMKRKTSITLKWEYYFGGADKSPLDRAFTDRLLQRAKTIAAKNK